MVLYSYLFDSNAKFQFARAIFNYKNRDFAFWVGDELLCDEIMTLSTDSNENEAIFGLVTEFLHRLGKKNKCGFQYRGAWKITVRTSELESLSRTQKAYRRSNVFQVDFKTISGEPVSEELKKALALLNDAEYSRDPWYKFLCYWKILSLKREAPAWIEDNKARFRGFSYYDQLLEDDIDLVKFFKDRCRNAIAHVNGRNELNSFSIKDYYLLQGACFSIEPFVKAYINERLEAGVYPESINIYSIEDS